MKIKENNINKILYWLLLISMLVRGFCAAFLEFGNDEVYYWTYALYPDWSHFDHPGMVGWIIQFFSLNLLFDSEFFIRLASVLLTTANTYIIFRIGKEVKNALTGLYAALLYTASLYAFVVTGIFILPDTPLNFFWLLAFWCFVKVFKAEKPNNLHLILSGLFTGLSILSKYTGAFIWLGVGLYILLFDRKRLKNPVLYLSFLISLLCCLPILYWNLQNEFVSFSFHGDRVSLFGKPKLNFLAAELGGEFFYNNPVNFILAIVAVVMAFKKKIEVQPFFQRLVLCVALPLIGLFVFFSLTRQTLPHWNAPAYNFLILLSACYLSTPRKHSTQDGKLPKTIKWALSFMAFVVVFGMVEIKTGLIPLDHHEDTENIGRDDFTLDMYGWCQLEEKFAVLRAEKIASGEMRADDGIVASEWFPLANLDYYVARPLGMKVMGIGDLNSIHKYLWINEIRGGFQYGEDFWFFSDSHYAKDPNSVYGWWFEEITPAGVITIERCGKTAETYSVYMCKGLKHLPLNLAEIMAN